MDSVKDSPFRKHTASSSNAKSGPKMKHTSKEAPHRKYYMPSNDTKTFQINSKGHLQCLQDPNLIHKLPIKSKEAIDKELDYLIEEEIITEQVEPTPWVSSVTFPRKPNGEVRVCLDPSNLNKAIIREPP